MAVVNNISNWINQSKGAQKLLKNVSENPAIYGTVSSFAVASTIRPAIILGITPDKDDAKYGAASSISAALVELIAGYAILKPMTKAIAESSKKLYEKGGTAFFHNTDMLQRYNSVANRMYKIPTIFATSLIRFCMVAPIAHMLNKAGLFKSSQKQKQKERLNIHG